MKSKDNSRWFFFLFGSFHELFWYQTCLLIVSHLLSWVASSSSQSQPHTPIYPSKTKIKKYVVPPTLDDQGLLQRSKQPQIFFKQRISPLSHYFCFWKWNFNLSCPMTFSAMGACSWWFFCCSLVSFVTRVDFLDDYGWSLMELCILNDFCIGYLGIHGQFEALDILMVLFVVKLEFPKNGHRFVWRKQIIMLDGDLVPYCRILIWLRSKRGLVGSVLAFTQKTFN